MRTLNGVYCSNNRYHDAGHATSPQPLKYLTLVRYRVLRPVRVSLYGVDLSLAGCSRRVSNSERVLE